MIPIHPLSETKNLAGVRFFVSLRMTNSYFRVLDFSLRFCGSLNMFRQLIQITFHIHPVRRNANPFLAAFVGAN